MKKKEGLL